MITIGSDPEVLEFDLVAGGAIRIQFREGSSPDSVAIDLIRLDGAQEMVRYDRRLDTEPPWEFEHVPTGTCRVLLDAPPRSMRWKESGIRSK